MSNSEQNDTSKKNTAAEDTAAKQTEAAEGSSAVASDGTTDAASADSANAENEERSLQELAIEKLKSIIDPELYIDIWTLGLIYDVDVEDAKASVRMTFTSMACPAGPQLVDQVRKKLLEVEGIEDVDVEVVFDPPWEPSEELQALMGLA